MYEDEERKYRTNKENDKGILHVILLTKTKKEKNTRSNIAKGKLDRRLQGGQENEGNVFV